MLDWKGKELEEAFLFNDSLQYVSLSWDWIARQAHVPDYPYGLQDLFVLQFLDLILGDKEIQAMNVL